MTAMTPHSKAATAGEPFAVMLRGAFLPTFVTGLLAVVVLALVRGFDGGLSAAVGLAVALIFFASGLGIMSRLVRDANPMLFMAVSVSVYLFQMIALLLFIVAMDKVSWLDNLAFGLAVLVVALAWQVFQMRAWRRARTMVFDEVASTSEEGR